VAIHGKQSWRASAFTYVPLGRVQVPTAVEFTLTGDVGEPDILARFEIRGGRPECVELTIKARSKGRDIRTSDLKGLVGKGVDALAEDAFAQFAVEPDASGGWTFAANELVVGRIRSRPCMAGSR
jgi:hypothetical protein